MQVCRHCGWENPEIAAFCTNCGTALGRGRATGPRFRALGLTGDIEEAATSSVDASWPTATAGTGNALNRTLVDFPTPDSAPDEATPRSTKEPLVPPPVSRNAPIARRTTGPVLLPDEMGDSVDMSRDALPPLGDGHGAVPPIGDPVATVDITDPAGPAHVEPDDDPSLDSAPEDEPEGPVTEEQPMVDAVVDDDLEATQRMGVPEDSMDEDGFDEFLDPASPSLSGESDIEAEPDDSDEIEIESPADSLSEAISDFADDAEVRIEPPSDAPEELEDELELSTSDLHAMDLEEPTPDVSSTSPAVRAVPPPLPRVNASYVLRPFSQKALNRGVVPVGTTPVVIGRGEVDVRVTDDDFVSPRHARFTIQESTLVVDDLDSLNGVWLRVRSESTIAPGDEILIGQQVLRVEHEHRPTNGVAADDGTHRFGAHADRSPHRLVQIATDGEPLGRFHISPEGSRIGRRLGDIVFTDDTFMSGTHALLLPRENGVLFRDLSSRNGCWLRIRGRQTLETGDAVMIGQTVWRVGRPVG